MMKYPPYTIEPSAPPCTACGHQSSWDVIGPEGIALGQSFAEEEGAQDHADSLNQAHALALKLTVGREAIRQVVLDEMASNGLTWIDEPRELKWDGNIEEDVAMSMTLVALVDTKESA